MKPIGMWKLGWKLAECDIVQRLKDKILDECTLEDFKKAQLLVWALGGPWIALKFEPQEKA